MTVYIGYETLSDFLAHLDTERPVYLSLPARRERRDFIVQETVYLMATQIRDDEVHYFVARVAFHMCTLQDRDGNGGDRGAVERLKKAVETRLWKRGVRVIPACVHVPKEALYLGILDVERDASPTKGATGGKTDGE